MVDMTPSKGFLVAVAILAFAGAIKVIEIIFYICTGISWG
jgi:hypothetical protein